MQIPVIQRQQRAKRKTENLPATVEAPILIQT